MGIEFHKISLSKPRKGSTVIIPSCKLVRTIKELENITYWVHNNYEKMRRLPIYLRLLELDAP